MARESDPLFRRMLRNRGTVYLVMGILALLLVPVVGFGVYGGKRSEFADMQQDMLKDIGLSKDYLAEIEAKDESERRGKAIGAALLMALLGAGFVLYGRYQITLADSGRDDDLPAPPL